MATSAYKTGLQQLLSGAVPFATGRIGVMLLEPSYTFDSNQTVVSNISEHEVENLVGDGYVRRTLEGRSVEVAGSNIVFKASNPRWSLIETTNDIGSAVLFARGFSENTSSLLIHIDLPVTETVGSDLVVELEDGIVFKTDIP